MRLGLAIGCVVLAGCTAPPSDGGLWARTGLQQELVIGRMSDEQRSAAAHAQELRLADETLSAEDQRLQAALQACPGSVRVPLAVSPAARLRDSMRVRVGDDAERLTGVARQALGDWYLRRAAATGAAEHCARARQALDGRIGAGSTASPAQLGQAIVSRNPAYPGDTTPADQPITTLVEFALGWTDTVGGAAPLPEHLALVYGGSLQTESVLPASLRGRIPQEIVDELAPAYPQWEPDALLLALTAP
jgi:hypothetical protein